MTSANLAFNPPLGAIDHSNHLSKQPDQQINRLPSGIMATPASDHSHAPKPSSHPFSSIRSKVDKLSTGISRLGVAVSTTLNPNHRHDEAWEKEVDAKMEAIRDGHRFRSFSGEREGNMVKYHVDGHGKFLSFARKGK